MRFREVFMTIDNWISNADKTGFTKSYLTTGAALFNTGTKIELDLVNSVVRIAKTCECVAPGDKRAPVIHPPAAVIKLSLPLASSENLVERIKNICDQTLAQPEKSDMLKFDSTAEELARLITNLNTESVSSGSAPKLPEEQAFKEMPKEDALPLKTTLGSLLSSRVTTAIELDALNATPYRKASALGNLSTPKELTTSTPLSTDEIYTQAINYKNGTNGFPQDLIKAINCFELVANAGNVEAAAESGNLYKEGGAGIKVDLKKAHKYFAMGANPSSRYGAYAAHELGKLILIENGDKAAHILAMRHFKEAILWGRNEATIDLMACLKKLISLKLSSSDKKLMSEALAGYDLYAQADEYSIAGEKGSVKDAVHAKLCFEWLASEGHPDAASRLGMMYRDGKGGVVKDLTKAKAFFTLGAIPSTLLGAEAAYSLAVLEIDAHKGRPTILAIKHFKDAFLFGKRDVENALLKHTYQLVEKGLSSGETKLLGDALAGYDILAIGQRELKKVNKDLATFPPEGYEIWKRAFKKAKAFLELALHTGSSDAATQLGSIYKRLAYSPLCSPKEKERNLIKAYELFVRGTQPTAKLKGLAAYELARLELELPKSSSASGGVNTLALKYFKDAILWNKREAFKELEDYINPFLKTNNAADIEKIKESLDEIDFYQTEINYNTNEDTEIAKFCFRYALQTGNLDAATHLGEMYYKKTTVEEIHEEILKTPYYQDGRQIDWRHLPVSEVVMLIHEIAKMNRETGLNYLKIGAQPSTPLGYRASYKLGEIALSESLQRYNPKAFEHLLLAISHFKNSIIWSREQIVEDPEKVRDAQNKAFNQIMQIMKRVEQSDIGHSYRQQIQDLLPGFDTIYWISSQRRNSKDLQEAFLQSIINNGNNESEDQTKIDKVFIKYIKINYKENFLSWGIQKQTDRIRIAKLIAQTDPLSLIDFITDFTITDINALDSIAQIACRSSVRGSVDLLSSQIKNFSGISQSTLIMIAEKAASESRGGRISIDMPHYGITDQAVLMRIAKIALKHSGWKILNNIQNWGLNKNNLLDIVMRGLLLKPELTLDSFQKNIKQLCGTDIESSYLGTYHNFMPKSQKVVQAIGDKGIQKNMEDWLGFQQWRCACLMHLRFREELSAQATQGNTTSRENAQKAAGEAEKQLDALFGQFISIGSIEERTHLADMLFKLFEETDAGKSLHEISSDPLSQLPLALTSLISPEKAVRQSMAWQIKQIPNKHEGPTMRQIVMVLQNLAKAHLTASEKANILTNQLVEQGDEIYQLLENLSHKKPDTPKAGPEAVKKNKELATRFLEQYPLAIKDDKKASTLSKLADPHTVQAAKESILFKYFMKEKKTVDRLRLINTLLNLHNGDQLAKTRSLSVVELKDILQKYITTHLKLDVKDFGTEENFFKLWIQNVEAPLSQRYPEALFVYAGKINQLAEPDKGKMNAALTSFIKAFMQGPEALKVFKRDCPHFAQVEALLEKSPDTKAQHKWESFKKNWGNFPAMRSFHPSLPTKLTEEKPFAAQFKDLIEKTLIADKHVTEWEKTFPLLQRYLSSQESIPALQKELAELSEHAKDQPELEVQRLCLELCSPEHTGTEMLIKSLQSALEKLHTKEGERWIEWRRDIRVFAKITAEAMALQAKPNPYAKWQIGITQDPVDMLLLAKETQGCQSIDGTPSLNKCALAYVVDHKNSAVVIKNAQGKIKARAILRALYDKERKTPVLFLERHYVSTFDETLNTALNAYAKAYAQEMGVPLLTHEAISSGEVYKGTIEALGGKAPFEYSDAGGGITKGIFNIVTPRIMTP